VARGTKKYARLIHDELFISWMVAFVWRQLNLRSCNLGALARIANLFKGPVDANHNQTKPEWVRAELERNPDATFYQIHFTRDEIKGKQAVWGFVPEHLVLLLEDYLVHQRSLLVGPVDHGTLFLNRDGNPLTAESLEDLFGRLTLQYARRWATPHLVRDAFAHAWLDDHPADYLTVSRVLMHRSIRQTLLRYGRNYDASRALEKTSTWLQQRLVR